MDADSASGSISSASITGPAADTGAVVRVHQMPSNAIANSSDYDPSNRRSVSNVVRFCSALSKLNGFYVGRFDEVEVGTLIMVGRSLIGIEDEVVQKLLQGVKERVGELVH